MARAIDPIRASVLALLLGSCAINRPPPRAAAVPVTNLAQVLADPAVERITRGLQIRGFELKAVRVSQVALLADAPGAAFTLADGALHLHAFRDAASATAAADRIVNAPVAQHGWAAPPMLYKCGSAIAMFAGSRPSVASALRQLCASPFYVHPSLRAHSEELLEQGPGELQSQVARLDSRRRQIAVHVRRAARAAPGGRKCAAIELPASAFLPVEITGDSTPELAVSLNQLGCPRGAFGGPSDGVVQFWSTAGRSARLVLEERIEGFTPADGSLVTLQHGTGCAPVAAVRCLVTFQWNPKARRMQVAGRIPVAAGGGRSAITFDHDLRRRAPGAAAQ